MDLLKQVLIFLIILQTSCSQYQKNRNVKSIDDQNEEDISKSYGLNKKEKSCKELISKEKKIINFLSKTILIVALITFSPAVYQQSYSKVCGTSSIGCGIQLNWDDIYNSLTHHQRHLIDKKNRSAEDIEKIISLFNESLYGEHNTLYDKQSILIKLLPDPRHASTYFRGQKDQNKFRGTCTHKALILAAILNKLNIHAKVLITKYKEEKHSNEPLHSFVYIPKYNLVADPTHNFFNTYEKYIERFRYDYHEPTKEEFKVFIQNYSIIY